jgi:hypothetical protein
MIEKIALIFAYGIQDQDVLIDVGQSLHFSYQSSKCHFHRTSVNTAFIIDRPCHGYISV